MNIQCSKYSGWYVNLKRLKQHLRYCEKGKDNETFVEEEYISSRLKDQSSDIGFKKQDIHPDADICPTAAKSSDNDGEYGDNCEIMFDNDVDSSFHPLHRKTMAVTNLRSCSMICYLDTRQACSCMMRLLPLSVPIYLLPILIDIMTRSNLGNHPIDAAAAIDNQ